MFAILPRQYHKITGQLIYSGTVETFDNLLSAKLSYVRSLGESNVDLDMAKPFMAYSRIFRVYPCGDRLEVGAVVNVPSPYKLAAQLQESMV